MENQLKVNWEEFCIASSQKAIRRLRKKDYKYKQLSDQYKDYYQKVYHILNKDIDEISEENLKLVKDFVIITERKEKIEKSAIYSQGVCDGMEITEKYI